MKRLLSFYFIVIALLFSLQGCIHEYPVMKGKKPADVAVDLNIDLSFDISWQQLPYVVDFSSRAIEKRHRFIIEALSEGTSVCRDEVWLSDEDFRKGRFRHQFSKSLRPLTHDIALWYDRTDQNSSSHFTTDNLSDITLQERATDKEEVTQCAYANTRIDVAEFAETNEVSTIEMQHAGARFQIVATDIQEFIQAQRPALLQGDSFSVQILFSEGSAHSFNIYDGSVTRKNEKLEYNGELWLPFDDYDELKIAEGFLFCNNEEFVTMQLLIYNSARMIVSETEQFSFPVKRGVITRVSGDFLTFPLEGAFSIDHIWEGEIEIII